MSTNIGPDLQELCWQHVNGASWHAGYFAEQAALLARDASAWYLLSTPQPPTYEPKLMGMPLRFDRSLPPGRIELRDRDGRVLGRIDNIGSGHDNA